VKQPAGVGSLPAIGHKLRLDGGFSLQRMRTHDPEPTLARIESGHSPRRLKNEKQTFATHNPYFRFGRRLRSDSCRSRRIDGWRIPAYCVEKRGV
jgi:hypothetical protein